MANSQAGDIRWDFQAEIGTLGRREVGPGSETRRKSDVQDAPGQYLSSVVRSRACQTSEDTLC